MEAQRTAWCCPRGNALGSLLISTFKRTELQLMQHTLLVRHSRLITSVQLIQVDVVAAMPYDMQVEISDGQDHDALTAEERTAFTLPTLQGEGIDHSHAGDVDFGGYDADNDFDDEDINEGGLEEIIQKPRYSSIVQILLL